MRPGDTWQDKPKMTPMAAPDPHGLGGLPGGATPNPGQGTPSTSPPPPNGCKDFDPAVVATCLDTVSAIAVLPDGQSALATERRTGRVVRVQKGSDPTPLATLPVDPAGDGGLTGVALSPSYAEDELFFAYITTPTDNRVVRIARGDVPKPVLTGIPRGATGNKGALALDRSGALLVATGDAGDPAAAQNPNSLAGKVLRIDTAGRPAGGNPTPDSAVVASGLHSPGGLCSTPTGDATWVTDRAASQDVLYRLRPGQPFDTPAWTWPDRPGVAGCAAWPDAVVVATAQGAALAVLGINQDGSFQKPTSILANTYGRFGGIDLSTQGTGLAWVGTVNKDGGQPISSDDRVLVIPHPNGGGGND
jgi:glucose/arabinose dehydrogenase